MTRPRLSSVIDRQSNLTRIQLLLLLRVARRIRHGRRVWLVETPAGWWVL